MVTIQFFQQPSDGSIRMTVRGHAGAAPEGEDLICGGASMLAYTVGQAVNFLGKQDKLLKMPKIKIRQGRATIIATPREENFAEVLYVFWVAQCGAHVLAHNYPEHVKLQQF